jgi:hypothetical protein
MRRLLLSAIFILIPHAAFSFGALSCGGPIGNVQCFATYNYDSQPEASTDSSNACAEHFGVNYCIHNPTFQFSNSCYAVALSPVEYNAVNESTPTGARKAAQDMCDMPGMSHPCRVALMVCDGENAPAVTQSLVSTVPALPTLAFPDFLKPATFHFDFGAVGSGISFGFGLILALLIYAKRDVVTNIIIHGNLPRKLPVYAEDIGVLFKRSQRLNWYGRVVFGITARLGLTEKQLSLVRRYWLGRVVAFDSLRRQRQNELARMHLQLAASMKAEPKDKKALSQILAFIKTVLLSVFYLLRALFSFLFGFLFIRITIAKLARGKLIESKDLVLVLQAKEAIEETARYLKEYLTVAETFDGREELFESK